MQSKASATFKPIKASVCDRFFDRGKTSVRNWHHVTGFMMMSEPRLMILHAGEGGVMIITKLEYDNSDNCVWSYIDEDSTERDIIMKYYHARDLLNGFGSLSALLAKVALDPE